MKVITQVRIAAFLLSILTVPAFATTGTATLNYGINQEFRMSSTAVGQSKAETVRGRYIIRDKSLNINVPFSESLSERSITKLTMSSSEVTETLDDGSTRKFPLVRQSQSRFSYQSVSTVDPLDTNDDVKITSIHQSPTQCRFASKKTLICSTNVSITATTDSAEH